MDSLTHYSDSDEEKSKGSETFSLVHYDAEEDDATKENGESGLKSGGIVKVHSSPMLSPNKSSNGDLQVSSSMEASPTRNEDKRFLTPLTSPIASGTPSQPPSGNLNLTVTPDASFASITVVKKLLPSLDELLPPKTTQLCDPALQEKLARFHVLASQGRSINTNLKAAKAFKNPDILEKLISYCEVNEIGSNYPKEIYDPEGFDPSDFYDEIAKQQQELIEKREADKKRTHIEFIRPPLSSSSASFSQPNTASSTSISTTNPFNPSPSEASSNSNAATDSTTQNQSTSDNLSTSTSDSASNVSVPDTKPKNKRSKWDLVDPKEVKAQQQAESSTKTSIQSSTSAYAQYIKEKKREAELERESDAKKKKLT